MSRPGLGAPVSRPRAKPHPFETAPRWEIKGAPKTQEELEGKYAGYTFEDGTVVTRSPASPEPPRVVITDESDKGPDEARKPTSWVPDQKVAYGGIGGAVTILLVTVLKSYGVEVDPVSAGAIGTLVTFLVQYVLPARDGS